MTDMSFEEKVSSFWDACDTWVEDRLDQVQKNADLPEETTDEICDNVEEAMNGYIEKGVVSHGEGFAPDILNDLHHLLFELALQNKGVGNHDQIHVYKDNAQVGITVADGKLLPENARLVMELNRAHQEKKGGDDEGVCDDCICGKK